MSKKAKFSEGSKRDNVKWTEDMDNVFIDAMLEQQAKGFRVDGTFTTTAYKNMLATCVQSFGVTLTKDHLKNRIKTFKSHFSSCHELFKNKSGISWNRMTKLFEADDQVWDELITANPHTKKWKITPVHNYDKLEELFSKDRAIGSLSATCKEYMNMWNKESEEPNIYNLFAAHDPLNEDVDATCQSSEHSTSSKQNKRKLAALTLQDVALSKMGYTNSKLDELISCMKEKNDLLRKQIASELTEKQYTGKEIFDELTKIGVARHRLVRAYVTLGKSKEYTRLFFSAPEKIRLEVLDELMNE